MDTFPFPSLFRFSRWAFLAIAELALLLAVASLVGGLPAFLS